MESSFWAGPGGFAVVGPGGGFHRFMVVTEGTRGRPFSWGGPRLFVPKPTGVSVCQVSIRP